MDFTWLTNFFNLLIDKIDDLVTFFGKLAKGVFTGLWGFVQDFFCFVVDQLFAMVTAAMSVMPTDQTVTQWSQYWDAVPQSVREVFIAVGGIPAMAIVAVALGIRLVLQLIPFVRLGS